MCGTGASALDDAVQLTRGAFELGFAAALIIPPFYYREASDDGVVRFSTRFSSVRSRRRGASCFTIFLE
jgi:4-hydroxy-tetrahydrodipicolinate synthase